MPVPCGGSRPASRKTAVYPMAFENLTKKQLLQKMESLRLEVVEYEKQESEKLYEEKLYRSLAVTAEAGVYIIKDGVFRFVNQFTASRLGCRPSELIGKRAVDFIHPDDREAVARKAADMLRGKRALPYEFRTVGKDGRIHWILESVTPIDFGAGRAVLGQSMDITRQVEARERLARLEALEASILESIPHAVIGLKNRQIIFANDGVEKVFGWKRDEVIGRSTRIFYRSRKEWAVGADNLYRSLETQRTFTAEVQRKRKDGAPIVCRLTASRIGDALVDKQVVITYEDITDQKAAEEVYMTMAENSQVGVYVVHGGAFLYINSIGAAYAGYRFNEISIIPQYAMNAMNPTLKIGKMTSDLLRTRQVDYQSMLPELHRRLDLVNLPHDVLNMYPIELSGGMKQRMVMVLSTLLNPSLLLADEITSALDVSSQRAVAEMLAGFRDWELVKSIIVITHDISILYQIADSILVMYAGQLVEKASTTTIIRSPRHPYTRLLISSLPKVGVKHAEQRLAGIPGNPPLLLNPPVGCRFRDRCPVAFDKCTEVPPFLPVDLAHSVACWKEI